MLNFTYQIEFIDDAELLTFENEHQLSKKPLEVDVLIVKKDEEHFIIKNIGNIFRKPGISPEAYEASQETQKI